jgi:hypothetical protein
MGRGMSSVRDHLRGLHNPLLAAEYGLSQRLPEIPLSTSAPYCPPPHFHSPLLTECLSFGSSTDGFG